MSGGELVGWDRLRHGGLLLDTPRLRVVARHEPRELGAYEERELRRLIPSVVDGSANSAEFASFVLERVCGFAPVIGHWQRGSQVPAEWGRRAVTGEIVKPRQLWRGPDGAVLPVFLDNEARLGIGRGRKAASQAVQWLRSGSERLAVVTNARQWRLVFAGLDFDAWCEWDVDLWLEEGALSPQVAALRTLISPAQWTPRARDTAPPLLQAILDSRKGQAELSAVLGERVREAVELLVQAHGEELKEKCGDIDPADIYRAAVRVVMRMVVVLFAESRELLPRDNALYHGAYGLTGLLEELERAAARGGSRLSRSWNAWPRVLALFRLVHEGSHHPALPVPEYGGELFSLGDASAHDGVVRALAAFETAALDRELLPDRDVHRMLERITRTRVKVRQGRASTWVPAPVDFSDLSSEYIGILYEGLLDFELKTAPAGDPVVFLAVGNQPALPLSRLEAMDDAALANLLETIKDTSKDDTDEEEGKQQEEEDEDQSDGEGDEEVDAAADDDADADDDAISTDERHTTRTRAEEWARRAVAVGKLARKPRGALTPEKRLAYEAAVAQKARQLVVRVILPGEWYLVRWGGTRKGSGTFYTRPGLAVPTVQRTLRPLAYTPPLGEDGAPNLDAPPNEWAPKTPEQILALKVCDPACGSGTFPVAALRFLTEALYASLHHHARITAEGDRAVVKLLAGAAPRDTSAEEQLGHELLPCRPDDALFEPRLKAILRRYVVERCLYGVDLDPLAVELCRLALWIETMDRTLPFSFLDHKVKCGNGLVGAWLDQFQHYPAMAWKNREGGDKSHTNGVHFEKEARGKAIKAFAKRVASDLADTLDGQLSLYTPPGASVAQVHERALATLSRLHDLPVQDSAERARLYREELLGSPAYRSLREAMDLWCACWFWPAGELAHAPVPSTLAAPPEDTRAVAARVAARKRFFHWEIEFPDVFRAQGAGFDAVLGNPPWETLQPSSKEYFSNIDPLYRSYGKQDALRYQTEYFADAATERAWLDYTAGFACESNHMKFAASPFGDPDAEVDAGDRFTIARGNENSALHRRWRSARMKSQGFADPQHPFRHRGEGKAYTYKLFLEQAYALLRSGGRLGFIVPSGLYSDHGTGGLRRLFLDRCRWEWLFGFENRDKIFEIDSRFKFNPIIVEKAGKTEAIRTAFMRRKLEDWEHAEALATPYTRAQVERFSPRSKAILEIQSHRDLEILEKIYANSVLLGDEGPDGWGIQYAQGDFNMTSDSKLFPPRPKWEADGYRPDEYSRWLKGDWRPIGELWAELGVKPLPPGEHRCAQPPYDTLPIPRADIPAGIVLSRTADAWVREERVEDVALPLYQGVMTGQLLCNRAAWRSGTGARAKWEISETLVRDLEPQFLVARTVAGTHAPSSSHPRYLLRNIARSTDARTVIGTPAPPFPSGHSLAAISSGVGGVDIWLIAAQLSSLTFDWQMRRRLAGTNLSFAFLQETSVIRREESHLSLARLALGLSCPGILVPDSWIALRAQMQLPQAAPMYWSLTPTRRIESRCVAESIVAAAYGLEADDLRHAVAGCARERPEAGGEDEPIGFWRVDRDRAPEIRHPILALVAFEDLVSKIRECGRDREKGIAAFLSQNDGQGWVLPETVRLADYDVGQDDRAKHPQPVASRLGPRFYDWQLAQSPEESWRECHLHARNLLGTERSGPSEGPAGERATRKPAIAPRQSEMFPSTRGLG